MSKIKRLLQSYSKYIAIPWRDDAAAAQRVIFCVYDETDERALRAKVDEFEIATSQANHEWACFDVTDTFAHWLASQRYAKSYFQKPNLLAILLPKYSAYLVQEFEQFLKNTGAAPNQFEARRGVGSLFGLLKVKDAVINSLHGQRQVARLFPRRYENNNYRLLDGYDGWNYHCRTYYADKDY